jgi:uncharacterized heparinase superfamily protein
LVLYNLHYLDELNASLADASKDERRNLLVRWIEENKPLKGVGWEPYPLSLRIVNEVKWILAGADADASILNNLHQQAQALSQQVEFHILGNHLLANAKALTFAGCFFDDRDSQRWLDKGIQLLEAEVSEQILADGGHFELSPMYQAIIAEDFLDLLNLARAFDVDLRIDLEDVIERMLHWLGVMTHGNGELSHFNDSTQGIAATLDALRRYADRLGIATQTKPTGPTTYLADSGYLRRTFDDYSLLIDIAELGPSYQPGHAHCDCLSFEMSIGDSRVLVNTGISTYDMCDQRTAERGTSAHNTVSIDGVEQSEIWGAFRVARRASPEEIKVSNAEVSAQHDGYRRIGITHRRRFCFDDNGTTIVDSLTGNDSGRRKAIAHFHFHPTIEVTLENDRVNFQGGHLGFSGHDKVNLSQYDYCRGFNSVESAAVINATFRHALRTTLRVTGS